ncbi:DUF771 domain-containing protein [Lentilactobacillus sp. SPB1-3]|uniref:DUF771 domain-containing protein n=1 Tax=Lentilactobacillus terminaliae TaxID=3003483 RepID=A0ACD5DCP2_9LACO|nr:DUF771 domain-containing protein [Lentilactobacillus sp. SPB1-3]MCZ0978053.1 DUF771 domain-containing protein [Lentilactobacillus sp. SPB1-3]
MPQALSAKVTIQIPDQYVLVNKSEYQEMQADSLAGLRWTMNDLRKHLGNKSISWIKRNILFNPKFKKELDQMELDKYLHRSTGNGNPWWFKAREFNKFIDKHWSEINWD